MLRVLLAVLFTSACVPHYPATTLDDRDAIDSALREYAALGRDVSKCDASKVLVYQPRSNEEFTNICDAGPPGCGTSYWRCAYSCFRARPGSWGPTTGPTLYMAPSLDQATRLSADVHEALHWASWCSTGDEDFNHTDPAVWGGALRRANAAVLSQRSTP
jgi:hypothetical protein